MHIQNGLQPIHHAAQEGKEEVIKLLIDKYNVKATTTSNVRMMKYAFPPLTLTKLPAIRTNFQDGFQPIHSACFKGHVSVLRLLVEMYGVKPTTVLNVYFIAFHSKLLVPILVTLNSMEYSQYT